MGIKRRSHSYQASAESARLRSAAVGPDRVAQVLTPGFHTEQCPSIAHPFHTAFPGGEPGCAAEWSPPRPRCVVSHAVGGQRSAGEAGRRNLVIPFPALVLPRFPRSWFPQIRCFASSGWKGGLRHPCTCGPACQRGWTRPRAERCEMELAGLRSSWRVRPTRVVLCVCLFVPSSVPSRICFLYEVQMLQLFSARRLVW